uniref:Uncharacterized protein n=1 Tax=Nothobranchius korthausae TaxID=1143690 RepID=A0A1A8EMD1_9TELE
MCWLKTLATALSYFREYFPLSVSKTASTESSGYLQPLIEETGRRGAPAASILVVLMWVRSQSQLLFTAPPGSLLVMSHYFTTATQIGRIHLGSGCRSSTKREGGAGRRFLQQTLLTVWFCPLKLTTVIKSPPALSRRNPLGPDRVTRSR